MKPIFTFLLVIVSAASAFSQDNTDYYQPVFPKPIGAKPYTTESLLKKFGDVRIKNRWYVGADGFLRNDRNTISNTFDGLVNTQSLTTSAWSAVAGWVHQEQWTVEAEYSRSAIHNVLIINGDNPLIYKLQNDKNVLTIRGKRRLLFGKASLRRSAFWVGAGLSLVPNSGREKDNMQFYGYREKGRRQGIDTLFLTSDTYTSKKMTGLAEVSAEYVVHVAKTVDISFFGRKQWGFDNSLVTNLTYSVNGKNVQQSMIQGNGTGWSVGMSLRYVFHIGYDFSKLHDSFRTRASAGRAL